MNTNQSPAGGDAEAREAAAIALGPFGMGIAVANAAIDAYLAKLTTTKPIAEDVEPAIAGLAYALQDADNTSKMAELSEADREIYFERAVVINKWLGVHGYSLTSTKPEPSRIAEIRGRKSATSVYGQHQLDTWTNSDFAMHGNATRATLRDYLLLKQEKADLLSHITAIEAERDFHKSNHEAHHAIAKAAREMGEE